MTVGKTYGANFVWYSWPSGAPVPGPVAQLEEHSVEARGASVRIRSGPQQNVEIYTDQYAEFRRRCRLLAYKKVDALCAEAWRLSWDGNATMNTQTWESIRAAVLMGDWDTITWVLKIDPAVQFKSRTEREQRFINTYSAIRRIGVFE